MNTKTKRTAILAALVLGLLSSVAPPANAAEAWLVAKPVAVTMPDGVQVTMWGFAEADASFAAGAATVPGPRLTVPSGDTTLTINVKNELTVPISIIIPGQAATFTPVRPKAAQGDPTATSFTTETAPGATGIYTWSNFRAGTFIYESGSNIAVQVQMGLYGAVTKDAGAGQAYAASPKVDTSFDKEVLLLYSEIDPALHAAVTTGNYGPGKLVKSTFEYHPRYFLINGQPYPAAAPIFPAGQAPIAAGNRVLVRFLSASLRTHVPTVLGGYFSVVSEDGFAYPYAKERYEVLLAAGKTTDAIYVPSAAGSIPIYDRRLFLSSNNAPKGGMLVKLDVAGPAPAPSDASAKMGHAKAKGYKVIPKKTGTKALKGKPGVFDLAPVSAKGTRAE